MRDGRLGCGDDSSLEFEVHRWLGGGVTLDAEYHCRCAGHWRILWVADSREGKVSGR
jgi:hypothetical protein